MTENRQFGKRIIDISELVGVFEAQEGVIEQIIGKTGNGKTYEGTRRALEYLKQGYTVYTTWQMILPDKFDERKNLASLFFNTLLFRKRFYVFDFKKNWHFIDIDRPDLVDFIASLTDCIVFLDEGQDIFDSYEGIGMSKTKRKSLTRTRHLRKTLIIISQRAQAVAVTARANVQYFYKCVKSWAWWWPFRTYFKVYRTEEMDANNFPIWEDLMADWQAELWQSHFANDEVYDAYNSWYLRAGIPKSQDISFEAYELTTLEKIRAVISHIFRDRQKDSEEKEAYKARILQESEDKRLADMAERAKIAEEKRILEEEKEARKIARQAKKIVVQL